MDLEHERRLSDVESRARANTKRLDKLEQNTAVLNRLAVAVEVMATKQDSLSGSVDRLTGEVESLKAEPGKRWKFVVERAVYVTVAAVVGFFLARIGL